MTQNETKKTITSKQNGAYFIETEAKLNFENRTFYIHVKKGEKLVIVVNKEKHFVWNGEKLEEKKNEK